MSESKSTQAGRLFEALLKNAAPALGQKIIPQPIEGPMPLSFAQQRMWVLDQLEPGSPAYNVIRAFRVIGPLEAATLEACLNEIVKRHTTLRTTFTNTDGEPAQVIHPSQPVSLQRLDLGDLPPTEQETRVRQAMTEASQMPFKLNEGPLWRLLLIRLTPDEHRLLLVMHHIIADGWSLGIFFRELAALYPAFAKGQPSPLPDLPIQYTDFTFWQRNRLQDETLAKQLAYWQAQFQNVPDHLNLPTDYPRPPQQTYRGAKHLAELPAPLTASLKQVSQQEGVTLFMTLLAAFDILLYRYTGQTDVVVGSPIANRTRAEVEGLIGCFINTLALRTNLSGNPTFRELLSRVRDVALDGYQHQDYPFEKLIEATQTGRHPGHSPIFQVMFVLQNTPPPPLTFSEIRLTSIPVDNGTTQFDLTLALFEEAGCLQAIWQYNSDLFETETVERMAGHYQTLLEGIVADPDQPIGTLPMLTEVERQQIVVEWNNTEAPYRQQCIHQLFEQQVEERPEAIAVVYGEEHLSYSELNARANQLAHYLQEMGVGPDILVGLCAERSIEMVIGLLGVLKAGGAYVPLDPEYPLERLTFMLEDANVAVLLTQERLLNQLPEHHAPTICLDSDWTTLSQYRNTPVNSVSVDNLAYVIYTSGSTGNPKGAMIPHRAIANHMLWMQDAFPLVESDCVFQKTPFSFDASVWEFYAPLLAGAQLVLAKPQGHRDPSYLVQQIIEKKITVLQLVPTLLSALLEEESFEACTGLKRVFCGGEALSGELQRHFFSRLPSTRLFNLYGPAEATIDTTVWECHKEDHRANVPIGRPIANMQTYVLDSNMQPVPIGVPGELCIGGEGLARGYHNQPDLTAERFVDNIFSQTSDRCLYKTGDLVRYLPDGTLEFLGRIDHQVKIRGFRIELGEIEFVLRQHPAVRDAIVIVWEDARSDRRLAAYLVLNQSKENITSGLRSFARQKLPDYMIPSAFMVLNVLPLNPSGKVDRRALPVPKTSRSTLVNGFVEPRTPQEVQMAQVWGDILEIEQIGVHDNFFDLGGHSMLAVRLITRIKKETGQKILLPTLFQAPTIAQLTEVISAQNEVSIATDALVPLQTTGSRSPLFCMPGNLGNVFTDLKYLVKHLPPDQPLFAFQDSADVPSKIEEIATYYLDQLRTAQPEGPYFMAGICSGAVIAYEMAQQLQAQQQAVALLALIEPSSPPTGHIQSYLQFARSLFPRVMQRFTHHSEALTHLASAEQKDYLRLKLKVVANAWAVKRYRPQAYAGQIHLFLTEDSLNSPTRHQARWGRFSSQGARIHPIPGTHDTITGNKDVEIEEDSMKVLAEKLVACIKQIR